MGRFFRRFFRFAFHLAAGFSALALVACLILWPLSYRRHISIGWVTSGGCRYSLIGECGRLWAERSDHSWISPGFRYALVPFNPGSLPDWSYTDWYEERNNMPSTCIRALGGYGYRDPGMYALALPFLYLTLLSVLLPARWLRWLRRARQARLARRGFPVEPAAPAR